MIFVNDVITSSPPQPGAGWRRLRAGVPGNRRVFLPPNCLALLHCARCRRRVSASLSWVLSHFHTPLVISRQQSSSQSPSGHHTRPYGTWKSHTCPTTTRLTPSSLSNGRAICVPIGKSCSAFKRISMSLSPFDDVDAGRGQQSDPLHISQRAWKTSSRSEVKLLRTCSSDGHSDSLPAGRL